MLGAPDLTSTAGWIYASNVVQLQQTCAMAVMDKCRFKSSIVATTRCNC
jgi:hypothetical protein